MPLLHLDYLGRSARVGFQSLPEAQPKPALNQRTSTGTISRVRLRNGLRPVDTASLTSDAIISGDPELDITRAGQRLDVELSAAWLDPAAAEPRPIGDFTETDIILDVAGNEKERRPHLVRSPNLNELHPVKIARRLPVAEVLNAFIFRACGQLVHQDGLTFDFLYSLAADLHRTNEMALLGTGAKGNQPLVIREGGTPYRAFLFGEASDGADGPHYRLLVMLSDQELKHPANSKPQS